MHVRGYDVVLANGSIWPGTPPQQASNDRGGSYVAKKCLQTAAEYGSIYVVKVYVCGHQNVIATLAGVSETLADVVVEELQCRSA